MKAHPGPAAEMHWERHRTSKALLYSQVLEEGGTAHPAGGHVGGEAREQAHLSGGERCADKQTVRERPQGPAGSAFLGSRGRGQKQKARWGFIGTFECHWVTVRGGKGGSLWQVPALSHGSMGPLGRC